jgi:hypothetical protein
LKYYFQKIAQECIKIINQLVKPGMMVHACNPTYLGGDGSSKAAHAKRETLSQNKIKTKGLREYLKC